VVGGVKPYYHFLPEGWKQKSASEISKAFYDVCIGAYLLNPLKNDYDSEAVITQYYDPDFPSSVNLFGKMKPDELLATKEEEYLRFIGLLAAQMLPAKAEVENKIKTSGMEKLFHEIEMPLSYCLFEMEQEGIGILPRELKAYTEDLSKKIDALKASITEAAGEEFNINSPKQLAEILFEKLGLPGGKKTKTGYSTAADVLEKLAEEHLLTIRRRAVVYLLGCVKVQQLLADNQQEQAQRRQHKLAVQNRLLAAEDAAGMALQHGAPALGVDDESLVQVHGAVPNVYLRTKERLQHAVADQQHAHLDIGARHHGLHQLLRRDEQYLTLSHPHLLVAAELDQHAPPTAVDDGVVLHLDRRVHRYPLHLAQALQEYHLVLNDSRRFLVG